MPTHPSSSIGRATTLTLAVTLMAGAALTGCASIAIWSAPSKKAEPNHSEPARAANTAFWDALHGGRYQAIPEVLDRLKAVYLDSPRDPQTAAHIAFAHVWRLAEAARLEQRTPAITDDIVLSRKYFEEAVKLSPADARLQGFAASLELAEGTVHGDEKLVRRGYFDLVRAKDAWPEFNLFTKGYSLSRLPHTEARYQEAVDDQWQTLDLCAEEKVDRAHLDYAKYMPKETLDGPKRACWNSWIAPHNFEGFFLNMGDMIVKQGDPDNARRVYAAAKLSKTYDAWPYQDVLEQRMSQAPENVERFRHPQPDEATRTPMVLSRFACMACHQG